MPPKDTRDIKGQQSPTNVKATRRRKTERGNTEPSTETLAGSAYPSSSTSGEKPGSAKSKPDGAFKIPDNPIPIVDFRTGTSPKRLNTEMPVRVSQRLTVASKQKKYQHNQSSASSITVQNRNKDTAIPPSSASPSRANPSSTVSRILPPTCRSQTPASETSYDNASTTGGITDPDTINSGRNKRTEMERKLYFENEPECGSIEVHRALCTKCKKWVRLSSRQTYCVKPWEVHREKCDQRVPVEPTYKDLGIVASLPFVVPRTEKVRKVLLELDDAAEIVEPEQIKCKTCQQWVPLQRKYRLKCWTTHKSACCNNLNPLDIEKTLERKLFFLCDTQFKTFRGPQTVECSICNRIVALSSDADYDLEKWLAHKETCHSTLSDPHKPEEPGDFSNVQQENQPQIKTTSTSSTPESQSQPPIPSSGPPSGHKQTLSTTDSERTLVPISCSTPTLPSSTSLAPTSASSPSPEQVTTVLSTPLKRKRDGEDDPTGAQTPLSENSNMDQERPSRRPRTESSPLEDNDDPSGLGWFLLPFQAFVQGFKESLTTLDS